MEDKNKLKKKFIIVNGTIGVGKTAVCEKLCQKIKKCVWLDGDWCWMMNPWMITEENKRMVEDNITHLLLNFLANPSFDYVIFSWVLHRQEILDTLLNPLQDLEFELTKVTLTCSKEALESRILKSGRDESTVQRALERLKLYESMHTIKVDTTELTVEEAADHILKVSKSIS